MKLKSLFASVLAFAAIAIACEPVEGDLKEASLKIEGETSFTVDSKSQTVEVSILSTRDWTATSSESWLVVDPESGSASDKAQKVELTVLENTSYDRTATVTFSIGTTTKKVTVTQTGNASAPDGTKENPFDVVTAVAKCVETGESVTSQKYYTKGIVSAIKDASGIAQYGNVSFFITDDGKVSETTLLVFQALYLGGEKFTSEDQIKVGDEVTIYGALVNYKGNTPETDGKGSTSIVVLNGVEKDVNGGTTTTEPKGTGTAEDPFNAAAANLKCIEVGQTASTDDYYVKGIISKNLDISTQYGNATFYISDDGTTTTDQFYVFRCYYIGGEKFASTDQLKVGDEVVVKGKLINYYGNTPEMNQGGQVVSVNGGSEVSDYLSISKASAEVSAEAGSIELSVASNTTWTVSCSESFVTLSTTSGDGDGTVTVSYAENTASEARSAVVSFVGAGKTVTFTLSQLEAGAAAANELSWAKEDWNIDDPANIIWTNGTYTVEVHKNDGGTTNPAVRDNGDIRAYAKATIVVSGPEMSSLSIVLASDAGYRYCEITADCGEVAGQAAGDTEVRWSGSSQSVSFTVGDYAIYGTDGETKAGQLRFNKILVK